jgi:transposase
MNRCERFKPSRAICTAWLIDVGIKTVAMESTGVYWVAAYEVLESRGLDVILANGCRN